MTEAQEEQEGFDFHLDAIAREAGRMADAARLGLKPQVPGCPDWSVADLVAHVADVYEFWTAQVEAATDERVAPKGGDEPDGAGGDGSDGGGAGRVQRSGAVPASAGALGGLPVGVVVRPAADARGAGRCDRPRGRS